MARTRLYKGNGRILINDRPYEEYFSRPTLHAIVRQALALTKLEGRVDVKINVAGGGMRLGRDAEGNTVMEMRAPKKDPAAQPQVGPFFIYPQVGMFFQKIELG